MNIITTEEQLKEVVDFYLKQDAFAFDVETVGPRRGDTPINQVLWITIATHGRADVIPLGHPNGEFIEHVYPLTGQGEKRVEQGLEARPSDYSRDVKKATKIFSPAPDQLFATEAFKILEPLMFSDSILTIGHNLLFDLTSVAKYYEGRVPSGPYFDTMVGSFLSDNRNKNKCGLADCLQREFGYAMAKGVGKEVEVHSFSEVAKYAYLDAKYTFLLWKTIYKKLEDADLLNIMSLEMDVLSVLCDMKLTGAPIDTRLLHELNEKIETDIEAVKSDIYRLAKRVFNINSNQDKQYILYSSKAEGGRGLKPKVLTPKGQEKHERGEQLEFIDYSVSADALEPYREKDEFVASLLKYADLNKLQGTYVVPYMGGFVTHTVAGKEKRDYKESLLINGRIHCDFIQHGAETGRFSSRNPNLQNVPAPHTPHGKAIRNLFYAPEGYSLIVADYSQIEPRVIASMSKDPIMMKNYLDGEDIYTTVGNTMGVDRKAGKILVLSMAYGVGPDKIAKQIGCTITEARDLLNNFVDKFKSVAVYRAKIIGATKAGRPPYVSTILGRKRYLPDITSRDPQLRSAAERQAFNTRIQGSAADIIKVAMVRAHSTLPEGAKLLLTVHDELVAMAPETIAEETMSRIKEAMEGINLLSVPLIADAKIVKRWGEAK